MGQLQSNRLVEGDEEAPNNPEVAWWCKLLARIVGAVGGVIAMVLGIWTCISVHALCILAGILQILAGLVVVIFEAPICCSFLELTKPIAGFAERRPYFQKAILFGLIAIAPVALCFGLGTIFGSGLIFATGVIYGLMALGKKADRSEMRANAGPTQQTPAAPGFDDTRVNLIASEAADQANPFSASGLPLPVKK